MSDAPKLNSLADIIYRIAPGEIPEVASVAALGARQVLDEYARDNPEFAKERRQHRRGLKAWHRERDRLADEVRRLQVPFFVVAINPGHDEEQGEVATLILTLSEFLFEHEAPMAMVRDLLRIGLRWVPDAGALKS